MRGAHTGTRRFPRGICLVVAILAVAVLAGGPAGAFVMRLSVSGDGAEGNSISSWPAVSADGRYIAFESLASNLVPNDTNGTYDVFVVDQATHAVERVSVDAGGGESSGGSSTGAAISADGRWVAFGSFAPDLVPGDTNAQGDVFVHDRLTGVTERVSVASDGTQGNGSSASAAISADGRFVAFASSASNLVAGDSNGCQDVFIHDRVAGDTSLASVASDGGQASLSSGIGARLALSADGRWVAFASAAPELVAGDTNGLCDVFVHDRATGATERVSVSSFGVQGDGGSGSAGRIAISADGRHVAFASAASTLTSPSDTNGKTDIFLRDRTTASTYRVSLGVDSAQPNDDSYSCGISADGRYVLFSSDATNLVGSDTNGARDVFVRDRQWNSTARLSVSAQSIQGDGDSDGPALSADGVYAAYHSLATNLVVSDTVGWRDVFLTENPLYGGPANPPTAPSGLTAATASDSQINLSWTDNADNETGFVVERSTSATTGFQQIAFTAPDGRRYADLGLTGATTYYYRICAFNSAGCSFFSNTAQARTEQTPPANVTAPALSTSRVRLTWVHTAATETGFRVERRVGGQAYALVASLPANSASWTDDSCERTTAYGYRVCATSAIANSDWAGTTVTTPSFDDVLPTAGQWSYVEAIYREGITVGCEQEPPLYCPNAAITRGQMAVFLCRAAGWTPLDQATPTFSDVPATHPQYGYVEAISSRSVTSGCGGGKYCPDAPVTRGQMAVFLCRAAGIPTRNPTTPTFGDVPKTSEQYTYVEGIAYAGITVGCVTTPPRQYCPNAAVTRGQMAVFLCRAFAISTAL